MIITVGTIRSTKYPYNLWLLFFAPEEFAENPFLFMPIWCFLINDQKFEFNGMKNNSELIIYTYKYQKWS